MWLLNGYLLSWSLYRAGRGRTCYNNWKIRKRDFKFSHKSYLHSGCAPVCVVSSQDAGRQAAPRERTEAPFPPAPGMEGSPAPPSASPLLPGRPRGRVPSAQSCTFEPFLPITQLLFSNTNSERVRWGSRPMATAWRLGRRVVPMMVRRPQRERGGARGYDPRPGNYVGAWAAREVEGGEQGLGLGLRRLTLHGELARSRQDLKRRKETRPCLVVSDRVTGGAGSRVRPRRCSPRRSSEGLRDGSAHRWALSSVRDAWVRTDSPGPGP